MDPGQNPLKDPFEGTLLLGAFLFACEGHKMGTRKDLEVGILSSKRLKP